MPIPAIPLMMAIGTAVRVGGSMAIMGLNILSEDQSVKIIK